MTPPEQSKCLTDGERKMLGSVLAQPDKPVEVKLWGDTLGNRYLSFYAAGTRLEARIQLASGEGS